MSISIDKFRLVLADVRALLDVRPFHEPDESKFKAQQVEVSCTILGLASGAGFLAYMVFAVVDLFGLQGMTHSPQSAVVRTLLSSYFGITCYLLLFKSNMKHNRPVVALSFVYAIGFVILIVDLFRPANRLGQDVTVVVSTILCIAGSSRLPHGRASVWLATFLGGYFIVQFFFFGYFSGPESLIIEVDKKRLTGQIVQSYIQIIQAACFAYLIFRVIEARERVLYLREQQLTRCAEDRLHLLQGIGHDLRQPMTAINLHCDLARNAFATKNTEAFIRSIDVVQQNVSAVNLELTQLTELAAAAENSENKAAPVAVGVILQRLYVSNLPRADLAGIDLHINLPKESALSYALSDEAVLSRVFGNILNNAIKFTELKKATELRSVSIDLLTDENCVKVLISDTGIGIAQEHLTSIWAPFFQVNNPERNREHGFGLGLAHVQASLNQLSGHAVSLESTLGVGTTFKISMPLANASDIPLLPVPSSASEVSGQALQGSLILVVEDDSVLREALADGLQLAGARVMTAATIAIANVVLASLEVEPDLVMVDYRLPDGNGRDFLETVIEKLGARASGGPALACLSGEHISALKLDGLPGLKLIRKPIDLSSLVEKLRHHLEL
jgi:signal transduction histidine kinase/CheY-like chemotaxis protein